MRLQMTTHSHSVPTEVDSLCQAERDALADQLRELIPAVAERIHYAEGRRGNYTLIAAALIPAGVALLAFIVPLPQTVFFRLTLILVGIATILLGCFMIVLYGVQTNRYPWTSKTSTW